jgi:hypothetical protein
MQGICRGLSHADRSACVAYGVAVTLSCATDPACIDLTSIDPTGAGSQYPQGAGVGLHHDTDCTCGRHQARSGRWRLNDWTPARSCATATATAAGHKAAQHERHRNNCTVSAAFWVSHLCPPTIGFNPQFRGTHTHRKPNAGQDEAPAQVKSAAVHRFRTKNNRQRGVRRTAGRPRSEFDCQLLQRQRLLYPRHQACVIGFDIAAKVGHRLALAVHQILVKVPARGFARVFGQLCKQRVDGAALDR